MSLPAEIDTTKPLDNPVVGKLVMRTGNVSVPTLTLYPPSAEWTDRTSVVISPEGGHRWISAVQDASS